MVLVVIYSASVVGHQKVFRGHRHPGRERAGRFFLSRFCRVLLTGVFVALRRAPSETFSFLRGEEKTRVR